MIVFSVRAWSAWAPGIQGSEAWLEWARSPRPPALDGSPELKFVPAMQRRRFSRQSRMALQVAFDATAPELLATASCVFASRHGEARACVELLSDIARGVPISPTGFSHAVHNTQGGLFSIAAGNSAPSSSIAAGSDTFAAGLIEALGSCERRRSEPTLLVVSDEPPPEMLQCPAGELPAAFALALLLDGGVQGNTPAFRMELCPPQREEPPDAPRLPQALEFLAWMLAGEGDLRLAGGGRRWRLQRAGA